MSSLNNSIREFRVCLDLMNDWTFLSSISTINFESRSIQVKPGYWRLPFTHFINFDCNSNTRKTFANKLKELWINRFAKCSANKIKTFLLGKIYNSFFNFKNIVMYYKDNKYNQEKFKKMNIDELRLVRYFEKKGKKHYKYKIRNFHPIQDLEPQLADEFQAVPQVNIEIEHPTEEQHNIVEISEFEETDEENSSTGEYNADHFGELGEYNGPEDFSGSEQGEGEDTYEYEARMIRRFNKRMEENMFIIETADMPESSTREYNLRPQPFGGTSTSISGGTQVIVTSLDEGGGSTPLALEDMTITDAESDWFKDMMS